VKVNKQFLKFGQRPRGQVSRTVPGCVGML